jgi:hypothetical protein
VGKPLTERAEATRLAVCETSRTGEETGQARIAGGVSTQRLGESAVTFHAGDRSVVDRKLSGGALSTNNCTRAGEDITRLAL